MINDFIALFHNTGFMQLNWQMLVMWLVVGVLLYLAVAKNFEPLLLVPIAFGALLANLPTHGVTNPAAGYVHAPVAGKILEIKHYKGDSIEIPMKASAADFPALIVMHKGVVIMENGAVQRDSNGEPQIRLLYADESKTQPIVETVQIQCSSTLIENRVHTGDYVIQGQILAETHAESPGGLFFWLKKGIDLELFPPIIFLGVGALTDFGPLIANPRTLLLGAAAQFGVFFTFLGALAMGMTQSEAASIGIIGGADGPTSIFLANKLAPHLLAPIAVAAYSYMALVPIIQPPIMRLLTTEKERKIRMKSLRKVSKVEKMLFSVIVMISCILFVPDAAALLFMLMLGNFFRECGVVERLSEVAQNALINITTIFLGTSVGITMTGTRFLQWETIKILVLGVCAFAVATGSGVIVAKIMNLFSKNKINPLIGSAGVSAVPMAARVSQVEGQKADASNYLLMHAMGPNVAGVIGTAIAAGYFLASLY
jgi:oxaloacetate decarboxylase beta subunit